MCVMRNGRWAEALRQTLSRVYDPTTRNPVPWLLAGESAMAVQGVNIEPGVVEFRAMSQYAVIYFAQLMKPYEVGPNAATLVYRTGGNAAPSDFWRSNIHQRVVAWSVGGKATWLGRWHINGVAVQASYIKSRRPDPTAQAARASVHRVLFEGTNVAVTPIEYLLADSGLKNNTQTTHRLLHTLRARGHDAATLQAALNTIPQEKAARLSRLMEINLVTG